MGISYIEMNEQKIPIEDEELRGVVPNMQEEIDVVKRTLGYTVTSKNLLPNITKSVVKLGLTFTYKSDGIVTVNGTATEDCWYDLCNRITSPITLKKNSYVLSGCANGGSDSGYYMTVIKTVNGSGEEIATDYGNGVSFTLNEDTNVGAFIYIPKDTTVNNLTFYPMIRYASIEDDTYEPYVANVKGQIDDYEEFNEWIPNAKTYTKNRCYYVKTKKMLTVYICFYLDSAINDSSYYTVCSDVKNTFGVESFRFGFTTCYTLQGNIANLIFDADANILKVSKLTTDIATNSTVYGQISCFIENWN